VKIALVVKIRSYPATAQRYRSETENFILEDLFSSVMSHFKKHHSSGNLKFNNLGILLSLKLRNLMGKILRISLNPLPPSDAVRQQKNLF